MGGLIICNAELQDLLLPRIPAVFQYLVQKKLNVSNLLFGFEV